MLPRNRQDVNDPSADVFVPIGAGHARAFAQEQGGGQPFLVLRQRFAENPLSSAAEDGQPARERGRPSAFEARHRLRRFPRRQHGADALIAQVAGQIKFTGIARRRHAS